MFTAGAAAVVSAVEPALAQVLVAHADHRRLTVGSGRWRGHRGSQRTPCGLCLDPTRCSR